jgi:hypothetical protein
MTMMITRITTIGLRKEVGRMIVTMVTTGMAVVTAVIGTGPMVVDAVMIGGMIEEIVMVEEEPTTSLRIVLLVRMPRATSLMLTATASFVPLETTFDPSKRRSSMNLEGPLVGTRRLMKSTC